MAEILKADIRLPKEVEYAIREAKHEVELAKRTRWRQAHVCGKKRRL